METKLHIIGLQIPYTLFTLNLSKYPENKPQYFIFAANFYTNE